MWVDPQGPGQCEQGLHVGVAGLNLCTFLCVFVCVCVSSTLRVYECVYLHTRCVVGPGTVSESLRGGDCIPEAGARLRLSMVGHGDMDHIFPGRVNIHGMSLVHLSILVCVITRNVLDLHM